MTKIEHSFQYQKENLKFKKINSKKNLLHFPRCIVQNGNYPVILFEYNRSNDVSNVQ